MLPKYTGSEILTGLATEIIAGKANETHLFAFFAQISARIQEKGLEDVLPIIAHAFTILAQTDNEIWPNPGVAFLLLQLGREDNTKKFLEENFPQYVLATIPRGKVDHLVIATQKGIEHLLKGPQRLSLTMLTEMTFESPSLN